MPGLRRALVASALALGLGSPAAFAGNDSLPVSASDMSRAPLKLWQVAWHRPLSTAGGLLEWKPKEPGGPAVDPITGVVVVGTRDGMLRALDGRGELVWEFQAHGPFDAPPRIVGDTVYAGCDDGHVYALELLSGRQKWSYDTQEEVGTVPVVTDDALFVATLQDTVFALDRKTGAWRWHHRRESGTGFTIRGAAGVAVSGDTVYAAYSDGWVAALAAKDGTARWERRIAPPGQFVDVDSTPVVSGSTVFVAAYSGAVLALDTANGAVRWQFKVANATRVALGEGVVLAVASERLYALALADGAEHWNAPLGGPTGTIPLLHRGRGFVANGNGLLILDASSGKPLRVFNPGTGVSGAPALRGQRMYVLSNGGELFALDLL